MDWRYLTFLICVVAQCKADYNHFLPAKLTDKQIEALKLTVSSNICNISDEMFFENYFEMLDYYLLEVTNSTGDADQYDSLLTCVHDELNTGIKETDIIENCSKSLNINEDVIPIYTKLGIRDHGVLFHIYTEWYTELCERSINLKYFYLCCAILSTFFLILTLIVYVTSPGNTRSHHKQCLLIHASSLLLHYLCFLFNIPMKYKLRFLITCKMLSKYNEN
jgi:hypothetical protein